MKIALTLTAQHLLDSIFPAAAQHRKAVQNESENYKYLPRRRFEGRGDGRIVPRDRDK